MASCRLRFETNKNGLTTTTTTTTRRCQKCNSSQQLPPSTSPENNHFKGVWRPDFEVAPPLRELKSLQVLLVDQVGFVAAAPAKNCLKLLSAVERKSVSRLRFLLPWNHGKNHVVCFFFVWYIYGELTASYLIWSRPSLPNTTLWANTSWEGL